jgi:hypothetical protein
MKSFFVNKNALYGIVSVFAIFVIASLAAVIFFTRNSDDRVINITDQKVLENYNLETESTKVPREHVGISLFEKSFLDESKNEKKIYLTLDANESKDFEKILSSLNLKKLHTNSFWDPKVCSQMIRVLGDRYIVLSDSFIEKYNESGFRTYMFIYDMQENTLISSQVPISIQKLFYNGVSYFGLSYDGKDDVWRLYKINIAEQKLELAKRYESGFVKSSQTLITATDTLVWCDPLNSDCAYDTEFDFKQDDPLFEKILGSTNPFELYLFYNKQKVLELKESYKLRSFDIGLW